MSSCLLLNDLGTVRIDLFLYQGNSAYREAMQQHETLALPDIMPIFMCIFATASTIEGARGMAAAALSYFGILNCGNGNKKHGVGLNMNRGRLRVFSMEQQWIR